MTRRTLQVAALLARPAKSVWRNDPNRPVFAQIIAGRLQNEGCLPSDLGLGSQPFATLCSSYFPGNPLIQLPEPTKAFNKALIPEWDDICHLLLAYRSNNSPSELWMACIIATACSGTEHLWQDIGLANREQLNVLLHSNFSGLARQNTQDMKWKKFIYKQFCEQEGIYVCPAPSCSACIDHPVCFAPEI
jgi:nitrogen fixation protein NifQ